MSGFGFVVLAHLLGDFLFQNGWMADHKSIRDDEQWYATRGLFNCVVHCMVYAATLGVVSAISMDRPMGLIGLTFVFLTHLLIDRYRLAIVWMGLMGQRDFKESMAPWSIIVIDNTIHLLCSFIVMVAYSYVALPWWL